LNSERFFESEKKIQFFPKIRKKISEQIEYLTGCNESSENDKSTASWGIKKLAKASR